MYIFLSVLNFFKNEGFKVLKTKLIHQNEVENGGHTAT